MFIQIISYILLPLVVAYITTVLVKRKEVELDAHGVLLEHRIQAYVEVYRMMQQNQKVVIVPLVEEQLYAACLEGSCYKNIHRGMEYPSYLSSISRIKQGSEGQVH